MFYVKRQNIVNSKIFFNRNSNDSENLESICSCLIQRSFKIYTSCESIRKQLRTFQKLLKNKLLINVFIF